MGWQPEEENKPTGDKAGTFSSKHLMFDGGLYNEVIWEGRLNKILPDTHVLKAEEELDLENMTLPNGLPFSGRPDQAICDAVTGTPEHILEHKGVHSIWTARSVLFQKKPKFNHIIQLATYMWMLERKHNQVMTGEIIYSSYVNYVTNDMVSRLMPRHGDPGSSYITYHYYKVRATNRSPRGWTKDKCTEEEYLEAKGKRVTVTGKDNKTTTMPGAITEPNYVKPFVISYDVRICHDGLIEWKPKESVEWFRMNVGTQDIESLYMMADKMDGRKRLPPIPVNLDATMQPEKWDACTYCPLKDLCQRKHKTVGEWKKDIKETFDVKEFPGEVK